MKKERRSTSKKSPKKNKLKQKKQNGSKIYKAHNLHKSGLLSIPSVKTHKKHSSSNANIKSVNQKYSKHRIAGKKFHRVNHYSTNPLIAKKNFKHMFQANYKTKD